MDREKVREIALMINEIEEKARSADDKEILSIIRVAELHLEQIMRELEELERLRLVVSSIDVNELSVTNPKITPSQAAVYKARLDLFNAYNKRVEVVNNMIGLLMNSLIRLKDIISKNELNEKKLELEREKLEFIKWRYERTADYRGKHIEIKKASLEERKREFNERMKLAWEKFNFMKEKELKKQQEEKKIEDMIRELLEGRKENN